MRRQLISFPVFLGAAFGLFALISVGIVAGYFLINERVRLTRDLANTADSTMGTVMDHIRSHLGVASTKLRDLRGVLGRNPTFPSSDERMSDLLRGALVGPAQVVAVAYVDVDGRSWRMSRRTQKLVRDDLATRPDVSRLIEAARAGQLQAALTWSPPITDSVLREPIVAARLPVFKEGRPAGILLIGVSLAGLSERLADVSRRLNRTVFVLKGRDEVLVHPRLASTRFASRLPRLAEIRDARLRRIWAPSQPMIGRNLMRQATGHWLEDPKSGDVWVYIFRAIRIYGSPWLVGFHYNASAEENAVRDFWYAVAIGGVLLVLFVMLGLWMGRRISSPTRQLSGAMGMIGAAPLDQLPNLPGSRIKELDQSATAFNRMVGALRQFERYAPPEVVRRLVRSGERMGLARHEATVLFADLDGFSGKAEAWSPEETGRFLSAYLSWLTRAIESTGGTVDKFMGDGVMACWGAPDARDDHALAALKAALRLRETIGDLRRGADLGLAGLQDITVRVGIHTGEVLAGEIGSASRTGYTLIGDAVNVAARLQDVAKEFEPGAEDGGVRIAISEETRSHLAQFPELCGTPVGERQVRGRAGAVRVCRC